MFNKNPQLNYTQVEALKMLITKNKNINDFIMIKWLQNSIEENEREKDINFKHSKEFMKSQEDTIKKILNWKTLEELYKRTAHEYAEITALLFT